MLSAWGKGRGGADSPIGREDVVAKFRKVTAQLLNTAAQKAIIEQCDRLDTARDATALVTGHTNGA